MVLFQLFAMLAWSLFPGLPPTSTDIPADDRVVKRFDFSEQKLGNFESFPRGWRPVYGPGFPRFLEARFDFEIGHPAAPSFKLPLGGGSVGAVYTAQDIPVNRACEYRISGWVRTEHLVHGSARLSACYLDESLKKIAASERFSLAARGEAESSGSDDWREVTFDLPAGIEKARWISVECCVNQSSPTSNTPRPIVQHDMRGTAWFDDIRVIRIPRLALRASADDQIFAFDESIACSAQVLDVDGRGIEARLDVLDADDEVVQTHRITPIRPEQSEALTSLNGLAPGFYNLRLTVKLSKDIEEVKRVSIIRLGPNLRAEHQTGPGIAIKLSDVRDCPAATLLQLIRHLGVHEVALDLWDRETSAEQILHGRPEYDRLLSQLSDAGIGVTAILSDVPRDLGNDPSRPLSVFDVLSQPPSRWRAYVTMLTARYAERVSAWQLGDYPENESTALSGINRAVEGFRNEAKSVIGPSRIVLAWPTSCDLPPGTLASDDLNLGVPPSLAASRLAEAIEHFAASERGRRVTLSVPPRELPSRKAWLGEWARRMVVARASGVQLSMVPQPWTISHSDGLQLEERFLVERTIAQTLDGMHSAGKVWLGDGLDAYLFLDDRGVGAVAMWRQAEEGSPESVELSGAETARWFDIWGNALASESRSDRRALAVGSLPVIVTPIDGRELQTLASLDIDSPGIRADIHPQNRTVSVTNFGGNRLVGRLRLQPPEGWHVDPEMLKLDLAPGESLKAPVRITTSSNAAIGDYLLTGQLYADGQRPRTVQMHTPIRIAGGGLDVRLVTHQENGTLHVVQRITNQTTRQLELRASLVCPDRLRQDRLIHDLPPGETAQREFVIHDLQGIRGQTLRASVEEIDGVLRVHQLTHCD